MTKRKRTWTDDDAPDALPDVSSDRSLAVAKDPDVLEVLPGITRKITACGACRKQKVSDENDHHLIGLKLNCLDQM
jgi:hypothetical protein